MLNPYKVNGEIKYWQSKAGANKACRNLNFENEKELWVLAWEIDKGWFLEDLWSDWSEETE